MSAIKEAPLSEAEVKELQRLKNDPDYADLIAMLNHYLGEITEVYEREVMTGIHRQP